MIVMTPKGKKLPTPDMIEAMWSSNPNGAGYMYPAILSNGTPGLRTRKQMMTLNSLMKSLAAQQQYFCDAEGNATVDFALHFRIASVGGALPHLTHPFNCGGTVALMHNGHISSLAYSPNEIIASSPPESASRQRSLGAFRDEADDSPYDRSYQPYNWDAIEAIRREQKVPWAEAQKIYYRIRSAQRAEQDKAKKKAEKKKPKVLKPVESDTSRLATILSRLPLGWHRNDVTHYLIAETFLHSDRVVLFDHLGLAKIIGEKSGTWFDGSWFSNTYWQSRRVVSGADLNKDKTPATGTHIQTTIPGTQIPCKSYTNPYRTNYDWDDCEYSGSREIIIPGTGGAPSVPPGVASEDIEPEVLRDLDDFPQDPLQGAGP